MKKTLIVTAVLTVALLAVSSTALAFEGPGAGSSGSCLQEFLSEEEKTEFAEIIEDYQEKMAAKREEMDELREDGEYEAFREARSERFDLMEEKREALSELVPAEFEDRFHDKGRKMRNFGSEQGGGGFNRNNQDRTGQ